MNASFVTITGVTRAFGRLRGLGPHMHCGVWRFNFSGISEQEYSMWHVYYLKLIRLNHVLHSKSISRGLGLKSDILEPSLIIYNKSWLSSNF